MICKSYRNFFMNFSNEANLRIIASLRHGALCVNSIVERTNLEQSAVSHCLRNLRECRIVSVKRNGKERMYSLNEETVVPLLAMVERHVEKNCERCDVYGKK